MPVKEIEIYPTCDVHLLMSDKKPMQLEVRQADELYWNANTKKYDIRLYITKHKDTEYLDFETPKNIVSVKTGLFTPIGVGETIGRIRHTDKSKDKTSSKSDKNKHIISEILVRVKVHKEIKELWIGNNRITIHKGEDNYVISVYARFTDGSIEDISSHPYLDFNSKDPKKVEVNNTNDKGRVKGISETTNGAVKIEVKYKSLTDTADVYVVKDLNKKRTILECIHGTGDVQNRRNILFLAEGFTQAKETLFNKLVKNIKDRLFNHPANSPFNLLKNSFNVWKAFDPSFENGITVGPPIDSTNKPVTYKASSYNILQVKDSRHGWMYGVRHGDRESQRIYPSETAPNTNKWYELQSPINFIYVDRRRMNKVWYHNYFIKNYIKTLEVVSKHKGSKYKDVNKVWLSNEKDESLVCYLVNDDHWAGLRGRTYGIRLSIMYKRQFSNVSRNGYKADHWPAEVIPWKSLPLFVGTNIDEITSALSHELAHCFDLGDEYEGDFTSLKKNDKQRINNVDEDLNLTHFWRIENPIDPDGISIDLVSWRFWHRIRYASILIKNAKKISSDTLEIKIEINGKDWYKWEEVMEKYQDVYLRTRDINFDKKTKPIIRGPFRIEKLSLDGTVRLKAVLGWNVSESFKSGSILYLPEKADGKILSVIYPKVFDYLKKKDQPFWPCKEACFKLIDSSFQRLSNEGIPDTVLKSLKSLQDKEFPTKDEFLKAVSAKIKKQELAQYQESILKHAKCVKNYPEKIPKFKVQFEKYVIGLYEGGGRYNCKIYRPSGICRMRKGGLDEKREYRPFCYVCKYSLVNTLDPTQFGKLYMEYPK